MRKIAAILSLALPPVAFGVVLWGIYFTACVEPMEGLTCEDGIIAVAPFLLIGVAATGSVFWLGVGLPHD